MITLQEIYDELIPFVVLYKLLSTAGIGFEYEVYKTSYDVVLYFKYNDGNGIYRIQPNMKLEIRNNIICEIWKSTVIRSFDSLIELRECLQEKVINEKNNI